MTSASVDDNSCTSFGSPDSSAKDRGFHGHPSRERREPRSARVRQDERDDSRTPQGRSRRASPRRQGESAPARGSTAEAVHRLLSLYPQIGGVVPRDQWDGILTPVARQCLCQSPAPGAVFVGVGIRRVEAQGIVAANSPVIALLGEPNGSAWLVVQFRPCDRLQPGQPLIDEVHIAPSFSDAVERAVVITAMRPTFVLEMPDGGGVYGPKTFVPDMLVCGTAARAVGLSYDVDNNVIVVDGRWAQHDFSSALLTAAAIIGGEASASAKPEAVRAHQILMRAVDHVESGRLGPYARLAGIWRIELLIGHLRETEGTLEANIATLSGRCREEAQRSITRIRECCEALALSELPMDQLATQLQEATVALENTLRAVLTEKIGESRTAQIVGGVISIQDLESVEAVAAGEESRGLAGQAELLRGLAKTIRHTDAVRADLEIARGWERMTRVNADGWGRTPQILPFMSREQRRLFEEIRTGKIDSRRARELLELTRPEYRRRAP